jgi:predicted HicB family RNase H-like nuclease
MAMVVRISEDEHRKFTEMADAKGLMLSSWVRMTLKEALEGVR